MSERRKEKQKEPRGRPRLAPICFVGFFYREKTLSLHPPSSYRTTGTACPRSRPGCQCKSCTCPPRLVRRGQRWASRGPGPPPPPRRGGRSLVGAPALLASGTLQRRRRPRLLFAPRGRSSSRFESAMDRWIHLQGSKGPEPPGAGRLERRRRRRRRCLRRRRRPWLCRLLERMIQKMK